MEQNLGERTTAKPRPPEGDKGAAKIKMHPAPIFALSQWPSSPFATNYYSSPSGDSDEGLVRIAKKFRAEGAKKKLPPFLAIFGTFQYPKKNVDHPNRGHTPNKSIRWDF